ncbi:hypothetical protein BDY21DRAFT_383710 [Lineolata rhizophorae]|uniref:DUF202 domain-containing protein n=1 Tax=Lineolata rhizophorae TaxID=578093 RepID=A0A6A6PA55_9PEZI|nr:hypothetical protein BDY21DRAFT_383710 [Lineolata rhizophorae]
MQRGPPIEDEYRGLIEPFNPFYGLFGSKPVVIKQRNDYSRRVFVERPLLGPLLFDNADSDARDHCANERTFLSWLRLSVYLAVVSVAIAVSFHLKSAPSDVEERVALPLGIVFWVMALGCLVVGIGNYIRTVAGYSRRKALVQSGWKTQAVMVLVAIVIIGTCVLFIVTSAESQR